MSSTLQPVYEAKSAVVILLPFTLLLSLVLSVLFALLYSQKITRPLSEISKTTERMKSLDKSALCRVVTGDEIGVLSERFNRMSWELKNYINQSYVAQIKKNEAELTALKSQIYPHFLYNTLDMINWLSQTGRNQEVTQAIQALSRFYKLTLSRNGLMNSIETELQHVSLYIRLQNMRYDNCVTFVMDVPDELYDYTIPKLTFQPIVENAFLHGIMTTEQKKGSILLTGWKSGDDIGFIISDDGAGIPPETLDTLKDDVNAGTDSSASPRHTAFPGHIGVYNTNLRLKSLYGESYGLSFTSTLGKGTEVTVRIPARHITSD